MALTAKNATTKRITNQFGAVVAGAYSADGNNDPKFVIGSPLDLKVAVVAYDFATDGATVAAAAAGMGLNVFFPAASILCGGGLDVIAAVTGPTNASFSVENDADVLTGAAIAGNVGHAAGLVAVTLTSTLSTWIKTTALREFIFNGTVAATTAGTFYVFVNYYASSAT